MAEKVHTKQAPEAIGPYSQVLVCGNLVFTSGQIAIDPASGEIRSADIKGQTEQVSLNLKAVLEAAGSSLTQVVKTTCFLADMSDFGDFNEVYGRYFTGKPAHSCVAVKDLPKDSLIEIEVIAEK